MKNKVSNKKIKVGINGAGRIGRNILKLLLDHKFFELSLINEINPDINNLIYLLNYDSIYNKDFDSKYRIIKKNDYIVFKNKKIKVTHSKDIKKINWLDYCDIIIDSSGTLKNVKDFKSIDLPIFITHTPEKFIDNYIIPNINDHLKYENFNTTFSMSICDVVAISPIINFLMKNNYISGGHITTLHPWLNYQNLSDSFIKSVSIPESYWSEYALGRSSVSNLIPKETSLLKALSKVLPDARNNFSSFSIRTPLPIVSSAIITFNKSKDINIESLLKKNFKKSNIVKIETDYLVSSDYIKLKNASALDAKFTKEDKKNITITLWYDNEYGYSYQILKSIKKLIKNNL